MNYLLRSFAWLVFLVGVSWNSTRVCRAETGDSERILPHWIWSTIDHSSSDSVSNSNTQFVFQRSFETTEFVRTAWLRIAADFCHATVSINDKYLLTVEPYSESIELDVTNAIAIGANTFRIEAKSIPGPSALAASLTLGIRNQAIQQSIVTDTSWTCDGLSDSQTATVSQVKAVSLGTVTPAIWGIDRKSPKIEATENYEQWRQAVEGAELDDDKFWTVPGFEIKRLRTATADEGSWVSMAFDPKGRLTIAREEKGLLRMTIDTSRHSIEQVELINDVLLECRGLLYAHDSLYANANVAKGLYRLRDTDGDELFDDVRLLREFSGGVGHGRNDLALGPEGWIYSIHGDSVNLPTDDILDRTSPFRDTLRSSVKGQGHVVRTDPEGKQWELVCTGLRNPFGLAVNSNGDWFTYDADAEFDMGTPWYRPTRVVQLRSGADYGWRAVTGKWPPYFPDHADNAMPILDIGKGSPTAVMFATNAKFPDEYRRALLILDWTYGRILAVHLMPRGAGYRANAETFLQGRPLNVTDLAIGPDGALYIITGGRKTQSSLYRIEYTGEVRSIEMQSLHEYQCENHAVGSRKIRLQLESMHDVKTAFDEKLIWENLDSPDWNLRQAARVALEHQPIEKWRARALSEPRTQAMIEAWLALIRSGEPSIAAPVVDRMTRLDASRLDLSQTMGLLQSYRLLNALSDELLQVRSSEISTQLGAYFPYAQSDAITFNRCGNSKQVAGECATLLANLGSTSVVKDTFSTLLASSEQEQILYGLFALRNVKHDWTLEQRQNYFRLLNEGSSFIRGEGMEKFLKQIRDEAIVTLDDDERIALGELLEPTSLPAEEFAPVASRPTVKQWTMDDLTPSLNDASYKPDSVRGKAIFGEAQCSRCHRSGARGPAVGPDLTHVANRFSRKDILLSMIEPSQVIAEIYRSVQVLTSDGRIITGRLLVEGDYRSQKITIATNPMKPTEIVEIDKREIESMKESPISPMPAALVDGFSEHEILDLLEYLRQH